MVCFLGFNDHWRCEGLCPGVQCWYYCSSCVLDTQEVLNTAVSHLHELHHILHTPFPLLIYGWGWLMLNWQSGKGVNIGIHVDTLLHCKLVKPQRQSTLSGENYCPSSYISNHFNNWYLSSTTNGLPSKLKYTYTDISHSLQWMSLWMLHHPLRICQVLEQLLELW